MNAFEIDEKWQRKWYENKIFEPVHSKKEKFFFTIPYPYVSGALHVGHGRTYTNGDIIARYKRMTGFNVLWPMAFHITGTPILAISSKIESGDENTIRLYRDYVGIYEKEMKKIEKIVQSFADPWEIVNYFSSKLIFDFKSMGYSLDLSRQFTTGDLEYNKFVEWQFKKYRQKNYLKQAGYPILYCPKDMNAVGEDDITGGDEEKIEVQKFITLLFELDGNYLVSATLRPDTFFGITNLFVNPDAEYLVIEMDGKKIIIGKMAAKKLKLQGKQTTEIREISGKELIGKIAKTPDGKKVPILPAEFVDPENATGIVHSVPAHAPFDYVAIEELKKNKKILQKYPSLENELDKIELIHLIDGSGFGKYPAKEISQKMKINNIKEKDKLSKATTELYKKEFYSGKMNENCGQFEGLSVRDAKEKMADWIIKEGYGFEFYEPSSKAYCRCGTRIVCAVMPDQWFIDFNSSGWKENSKKCLDKMRVYPEGYKKQFEDILEWLDKRPCARRRGIGTKLPFDNKWIIESLSDSTMYMAFYTIIKKIREKKLTHEKLTEEFFDYVFLGIGNKNEEWKDIRKEFLYWYPNDLRHTAVAHITNHLIFMIFAHTAIFEEKYWPAGISLNEMLISEGRKMSKSKGNVIMLNHVSKEYGADAFRLYISSAADFSSVLDFRKKDCESAKRAVERYCLLMEGLIQTKNSVKEYGKIDSHMTRWMKSTFERAVIESGMALKEFRIRDYVQIAFYKLMNDFEYFSKKATEQEKIEISHYVCERWIKLLAPVIPHNCEELWEKLKNKGLVSVEKWPEAIEENINGQVEIEENYLKGILEDVKRIRGIVRIKPSKVLFIIAGKLKNEKLKIELSKDNPEEVKYFEDNLLYLKNNFYKLKGYFKTIDEKGILEEGKEFLQKELGLKIIIEEEEYSKNEKAKKAFPQKPAILLE
ncbi:MAG: leucine--tRNA ligase [Candidatus Micrarchaeia archaeon]